MWLKHKCVGHHIQTSASPFPGNKIATRFNPATDPALGGRCCRNKGCCIKIQSDINNLRWRQRALQIKMRSRWEQLRWVTVRQIHSNACLPACRGGVWADADVRSTWAPRRCLLPHRSLGRLLLIESVAKLRYEHCFHLFGHTGANWRCEIADAWREESGEPEKGWEAVVGKTERGQHCMHNMSCLVGKDLASWVASTFVTTKLYFPSLPFTQLLIANKLTVYTDTTPFIYTDMTPFFFWSPAHTYTSKGN